MTKKTRLTNYVEEAKQRTSPLLQNIFRFSLPIYFSACNLVWEILRLSFSVYQADVVTLCIIFYCVHEGYREMQIMYMQPGFGVED